MQNQQQQSQRPVFSQQLSIQYNIQSKMKPDKDSHEKLLEKSSPYRHSFEVDYKKIQFQTQPRYKKTQYNPYQHNQYQQQEYCYPKAVSCIGSFFTPCKIICPCFCCSCCPCSTNPIFRQQMTSLGLLQQWGKYLKVLPPGLHIINPISQNIIEMSQQTMILQYSQNVISKDNVQCNVDIVIFYRIVDSIKCAYRLGNYDTVQCIKQIAMGTLRQICGQNTLQNIIEERSLITNKFTNELNNQIQYWGLYVQISSLKQIIIDAQIRKSLQMVTQTKRFSQAMIIGYKSEVECGKLIKQISEIINNPASYQIRYFNFIEELLKNGQNNVMIVKMSMKDHYQG